LLLFFRRDDPFWGKFQTSITGAPQISKTLCLDVIVPGVFRVPIGVIVIEGDSRDVIHDVWVSLTVCAVQADRLVMYFRRRTRSGKQGARTSMTIRNEMEVSAQKLECLLLHNCSADRQKNGVKSVFLVYLR